MQWEPTSEAEIWDMINKSYGRMTAQQKRLWEVIKVDPVKWQQHPNGDEGKGFWVVAILGKTVVWFNDIEEGFNFSVYTEFGRINEYWCNQDELEHAIQKIIYEINGGPQ